MENRLKASGADEACLLMLFRALSASQKSDVLRVVASHVVESIISPYWSSVGRPLDEGASYKGSQGVEYLLDGNPSDTTMAQYMLANERMCDIEENLYTDSRAEVVLVADDELESSAIHYLDCMRHAMWVNSETAMWRPEQGLEASSEEDVSENEVVGAVVEMLADWRDTFFSVLVRECKAQQEGAPPESAP